MDSPESTAGVVAQRSMSIGADEVIELSHNQRLVITRANPTAIPATEVKGEDCLQLLNAEGTLSLKIRMTPDGPVIEVGGRSVGLKVEGDLAIGAGRLFLHGKDGVSISSDGNVGIMAGENLVARAKRQEVTATLGDVRVYANDDVKIDGERIRMNC